MCGTEEGSTGECHSEWSQVVNTTTAQAGLPDPPRNVLARSALPPNDGNTIIVQWERPESDGSAPITGYEVQWSANGTGGWRGAGRADADTLAFTDGNLGYGTTRYYRVAARNSRGLGPYSSGDAAAVTSAQEEGASLPGAPRNLSLTAGSQQIWASWDPPASDGGSDIEGYRVQFREGRSGAWEELSAFPKDTNTGLTGIPNGVEFQVRVAAVNGAGTGPYTTPESATPHFPPGTPRGLSLTAGDGRLTVHWDPPELTGNPPLNGYSVQYRESGTEDWRDWRHRGTGTEATITGLTNGTEYQVRVAAVSPPGRSGYAEKSARPGHPPGPPRNLTLTTGDGQIKAEWDAPEDPGNPAFGGYTVSYLEDGASTWHEFSQPGSVRIFEGLTNGKLYQVRVAAFSNYGLGEAVVLSVTLPAGEGATGTGGQGKEDNRPPTADAGPDQAVDEGATVTLAGKGTDPEGQSLTYAWIAPSGITLSNATAAQPSFTAPDRTADYTLTFSLVVNDGSSDSAADTVEISVAADNDPPGAPSLDDQTATEGEAFSYQFAAVSDPEGATPSYTAQQVASDDTASALPSWLSFNAGSRTFSCAASGDGACVAGTLTIRVTASDGASPTPATSSATFTLTVKEDGDGGGGAGGESEEGERPPTAPRSLALTAGDGQIAVSWDAPADLGDPEADAYIVEFREAGAEEWEEAGWFTDTEAVIEWLDNGTEYEVRVWVGNNHGEATTEPKRATPSAG